MFVIDEFDFKTVVIALVLDEFCFELLLAIGVNEIAVKLPFFSSLSGLVITI